MVNYQNAKVYKIVDNTNGKIYVGSTCESTLARRLAGHVSTYKQYLNDNCNYVTSIDIIKNNDYEIVLLEEVKDCTSKDQLKARERHYIESLECVNKVIPGRTDKEYKQDNKENIKEYNKQYNKLKSKCECGIEYVKNHKAHHIRSLTHYNYVYMKNYYQQKMEFEYEIILTMEERRKERMEELDLRYQELINRKEEREDE